MVMLQLNKKYKDRQISFFSYLSAVSDVNFIVFSTNTKNCTKID